MWREDIGSSRGKSLTKHLFCNLTALAAILASIAIISSAELGHDGIEHPWLDSAFVILALAYSFSFVFKLDARVNFSLATVSSVFVIYCLELFTTCSGPQWFVDSNFDGRSKVSIIDSLRGKYESVVPWVSFTVLAREQSQYQGDIPLFPLSGISSAQTVYCNETGRWSVYASDRFGFNNPVDAWAGESTDIVILGDSFAHGACVDKGKDVGSILREDGYRVVNLGFGGNGPLAELGSLKEYGASLHPKTVLWLYYDGNDIENLNNDLSTKLTRYLDSNFSQDLRHRQTEVDALLKTIVDDEMGTVWRRWRRNLFKFVKLQSLRSSLGWSFTSNMYIDAASQKRNQMLFKEILLDANRVARESDAKLYFVFLPSWDEVRKGSRSSTSGVLEAIAGMEIPIIDFYASLQSVADPLSHYPFRSDGHYNATGYRLLADTIAQRLAADRGTADAEPR